MIATATRPFGGESTVIALDVALTCTGRIPALDLAASGVVRPELLVGEDGAEAITKARASASRRIASAGRRRAPTRARARARSARRCGPIADRRGLHVGEAARLLDEGDPQLALVDALVEPRAAEHQAAQPVHQRALRRADQLRPAVVDVLAQRRGRVVDLAVDGQVDEVFELVLPEPPAHEAQLQRGLLAALGEVLLVEGEAQLPVFEDEVLSRVVISAACLVHDVSAGVSIEEEGLDRSRVTRAFDASPVRPAGFRPAAPPSRSGSGPSES